MGDPKGFMEIGRNKSKYRPVCERVRDYKDVTVLKTPDEAQEQAGRCMDCGTPFCHWGCPVGNYIPEWNDFAYDGNWKKAFELLQATNNFPEFTGRLCPAPCEYACVLGINDDPITIRENELAIIEYAFEHGFVKPLPPEIRTGKKIAIVGSGPAGLACAAQLNSAGHNIVVLEKNEKIGGLLRFGIPDYKLEKKVIDRRLKIMESEGIEFRTGINAGEDIKPDELLKQYDAVCLTGGSEVPRDLNVEGRVLSGIYFAMDYLMQSNRRVMGQSIPEDVLIDAKGKKIVVIGGGDTGADCVGTAHRQGASCVTQIEVMPRPEECRTEDYPWPKYPLLLKTSSSHEEGGERDWAVLTKKFTGEAGQLKQLECVKVDFKKADNACPVMKEIQGSEFTIDADIVVLAIGFIHPEYKGLLKGLGVDLDERGNVRSNCGYDTSIDRVYTAGDMHRGQSLIVWAISEGRKAARQIDEYLMGESFLPEM